MWGKIRTLNAVFGFVALVWGIPGMLDDANVWAKLFEEHPIVSWVAGIGGLVLILTAMFLTEKRKNALVAHVRVCRAKKLATKQESALTIIITWDEIKDRSYNCPEVACLCCGFRPTTDAMTRPDVQAWMNRLNRQMTFLLSPIDNATVLTMENWMLPIYGACEGGEYETPDIYSLYEGGIEALELK